MLAIKGAIVSIDAMGAQKAIAAKIVEQEADYVLALKGNQSALHDDVKSFLEDAEPAKACAVHKTTDAGHGRIAQPECRATDAIDWLRERRPDRQNLRGIAAITAKRIDKKTGQTSVATRFYITSLPAGPAAILAATRAHGGIENNLHGRRDITFEDRCRTRKDFSPLNLAIVRHIVLNMLKHAQARRLKIIPQAQTPEGFRQPRLQGSAACLLTISDLALDSILARI